MHSLNIAYIFRYLLQIGELSNKIGKHGPYKIRKVTIEDANTTMTAKMWGQYADMDLQQDQKYEFNNMEVDQFGSFDATIQTTDLTKINIITDHKQETNVTVIGINEQ